MAEAEHDAAELMQAAGHGQMSIRMYLRTQRPRLEAYMERMLVALYMHCSSACISFATPRIEKYCTNGKREASVRCPWPRQ